MEARDIEESERGFSKRSLSCVLFIFMGKFSSRSLRLVCCTESWQALNECNVTVIVESNFEWLLFRLTCYRWGSFLFVEVFSCFALAGGEF
jgi:hypothetical protein